MHLYSEYAGEFVMWNNNMPHFHLIHFLVCESLQLLSFPGAVNAFNAGTRERVFKKRGRGKEKTFCPGTVFIQANIGNTQYNILLWIGAISNFE